MKRILLFVAIGVVVAGLAVYTFRAPLMAAVVDRVTANMFVASDDDAYDPGIAVGQTLPALHARIHDREITQLSEFMGKKGLVLFLNRSVDW